MLSHIQNIFCKHAFSGRWRGLRWGIIRACNVSCQHRDNRNAAQINMQCNSTTITHAIIHHSLSFVRKCKHQTNNDAECKEMQCDTMRVKMQHNACLELSSAVWTMLPDFLMGQPPPHCLLSYKNDKQVCLIQLFLNTDWPVSAASNLLYYRNTQF